MDTNDVSHDLFQRVLHFTLKFRVCSIYLVLLPLVLQETRSSVLLTGMAKTKQKETGDHRYRARAEDERESLKNLIYVSCTRPIRE